MWMTAGLHYALATRIGIKLVWSPRRREPRTVIVARYYFYDFFFPNAYARNNNSRHFDIFQLVSYSLTRISLWSMWPQFQVTFNPNPPNPHPVALIAAL
jgi:hypothetical protein